jgi:hypothetical protein
MLTWSPMQGIVDLHVHFITSGLILSRLDLRGISSREAFRQAVATAASR